MSLRSRSLLAAVVALWMAHPLPAQEPANQQLANAVAGSLRQGGLKQYRIDVAVRQDTAELSGTVADAAQRDEALRLAQNTAGISRVVDKLSLAGGAITRVQAQATEQGPAPRPTAPPVTTGPVVGAPPANFGGEPVPLIQGPAPGYADVNAPRMPPYAWPTYAPYNNYSRVAYPELYPYNAWPFIGPMHPFPKIPLGWRSVKLEWEDGHWWYKKVATKHDWWRIRYW